MQHQTARSMHRAARKTRQQRWKAYSKVDYKEPKDEIIFEFKKSTSEYLCAKKGPFPYFKITRFISLVLTSLKIVSPIFPFLNKMIALKELWKMLLKIIVRKLFSISRYSSFCISLFLSFSSCQPLLEKMIQYKPEGLWCHQLAKQEFRNIIWYLEEEQWSDFEIWSIDRVLNKEHFYGKRCWKCAPKARHRPFSILVNSPELPLHARNFLWIKYFERGLSKNL